MKNKKDMFKEDLTELTHSFQDACADKDFKDFVYGLNIKEDILMKYTTQLEEALEEYENCKKCKSLDNCKNKIKGYSYTPTTNEKTIIFSYDACPKLLKKKKKNHINKI